MAIDIFEPLKDLQGNKLKSATWYRNAVSLIADRTSPSQLFKSGKLLGAVQSISGINKLTCLGIFYVAP